MTTGIYRLVFKGTNKVYVGQAKNIEKRYTEHLYTFKHKLASKKLQQAYHQYGEPTYDILCECTEEELTENENLAIDVCNAYRDGFNTLRVEGGSTRGLTGLQHPGSKYSKILILRVFSLLYTTTIPYSHIALKLGLSNQYLVNNIASGLHHLWLKTEYPIQFQKMLDNKIVRNNTNLKTLTETKQIKSPNGEIHNISNIAEFCRSQPDLAKNLVSAKSSIAKVLRGVKPSHLGWTVP